MKKKFIVKKTFEFNNIINSKNKKNNKYYSLYYNENKLGYNRFGISVPKKIGKANIRNKYKRRIRSIIDNNKNNYPISFDYIIIMKKECLNQKFVDLEKNVNMLIKNIDRNDLNEKEQDL